MIQLNGEVPVPQTCFKSKTSGNWYVVVKSSIDINLNDHEHIRVSIYPSFFGLATHARELSIHVILTVYLSALVALFHDTSRTQLGLT